MSAGGARALMEVRSLEVGGRALSLGWAQVGGVGPESLTARERSLLSARATGPRTAQFAAGREAARRALQGLGVQTEGLSVLRRAATHPDAGRPFPVGADGRPLEIPLSLGLTHAGELACAAAMVGAQSIGVDLECTTPPGTAAFEAEAFAPGELEGFGRLDLYGAHPRTVAWTLKEAALKVWGVGLRAVLPQVRLVPGRTSVRASGSFGFTCTLTPGVQPPGLPPPPLRLACVCVIRADAVLSVALALEPDAEAEMAARDR